MSILTFLLLLYFPTSIEGKVQQHLGDDSHDMTIIRTAKQKIRRGERQ